MRQLFLENFISRYYKKGQRKRRTADRNAYKIAQTVNLVARTFDKKLKFELEEILKAFERCGFTLMETGPEEFTWERFHKGHTLIIYDLFINIEVQCDKDLRMTRKGGFAPIVRPETIRKIEGLRQDLSKFWEENNSLLEY